MARSRLDDTLDFIELLAYVAGDWTTPRQFHVWSGLSLIAACVEDRVWLPFTASASTYPNIWVFLIGKSGTGKDHAIRTAKSLLREDDSVPWLVDGKVTIPALYDYLAAKQKAAQRDSAPMYLVSTDVTEQLPLGVEAKEFTSRILALYDRHDRVLLDLTRTRGDCIVKRPVVNWIAGCTPEWFPLAIDPQVFTSGLAGRSFFIYGEPRLEHFAKEHPTRRHDEDVVREYLRQRVEAYQTVEGMFIFTPRGSEHYAQWLAETERRLREGSLSELDKQVVIRMRVQVKKLAMLFMLSRWPGRGLLAIDAQDVGRAVEHAYEARDTLAMVSTFAYVTVETAPREAVAELIRMASPPGIEKTKLMRLAASRGVKSTAHFEEILKFLKDADWITLKHGPFRPGQRRPVYVEWKKRKLLLGDGPRAEVVVLHPETETADGAPQPAIVEQEDSE